MYTRCPKCARQPLPEDQAWPVACPGCGVILSKVHQGPLPPEVHSVPTSDEDESDGWRALLFWVPERVDPTVWWLRLGLWCIFLVWGLRLIAMDYRTGELGTSFLHGPLLVFHEAGHVIFRLLGDWVGVLGGTLGQCLMPIIMSGALLIKNRDPFGAALGLWLFGVSLLDVAPYMFDALHPQLMLLSGTTGEEGGHDWIELFSSVGWLQHAQTIGAFTHKLGALVTLLALAWAAIVLHLQYARRGHVGLAE